ncbi:MAG TPA: hypothetical protein VM764_01195 [Gemmatimonadaceae bacterium]|jgi:hypothetical protein|nr:hypothetical protein [Gemmatimonadaceae bacterium]
MPVEQLRLPATLGLSWQVARWKRVVPARLGGAALLVPCVLFFLPLGDFGWFQNWRHGARVAISLSAVAATVALGRDSAAPQPSEFWVYQKGLSLADWGLARWLLDMALVTTILSVWLVAFWAASFVAGDPERLREIAALVAWLLLLQMSIGSLLFVIGATGSSRGTEYSVLLFFLTLLQPLIAHAAAPPWVGAVANAALPPIHPALDVRAGIMTGATFLSIMPPLLHVGAYVTLMLVAGTFLLARRRPEEGA